MVRDSQLADVISNESGSVHDSRDEVLDPEQPSPASGFACSSSRFDPTATRAFLESEPKDLAAANSHLAPRLAGNADLHLWGRIWNGDCMVWRSVLVISELSSEAIHQLLFPHERKWKAMRWRAMEPEGKMAVFQLVNGCQPCGCGQVHGKWSTNRWNIGTDAPVTLFHSSELDAPCGGRRNRGVTRVSAR
jgi:hypothetical protein